MSMNGVYLYLASKRSFKRSMGFVLPEIGYIDYPDFGMRMFLSLKDMKGPSYHLLHRERRFMEYEEKNRSRTVEVLKSLGPNPIYFDIGSNIGLFSTMVAKQFPKSQVYAFDPDPVCYLALSETKIFNRLENLHLMPVGLGERTGLLEFYFDPLNHGGHSFDETNIQSGGKPIRSSLYSFRLDELMEKVDSPKVDLMKVDVQGFEWQVLRGAQNTILKHRPVMLVECEHKYAVTAGDTIKQLFSGYTCETSDGGTRFNAAELPQRASELLAQGRTFSDFWFFPAAPQ